MVLWKKIFRDILNNRGSYLACLTVAIIGLTAFTAFSLLRENLNLSKEILYREQNFAHGFIELESMPQGHLDRLFRVEGIRDISGRIVNDVQLYDPHKRDSIYLTLVSLDLEKTIRVNDVRLLQGIELIPGREQAWIDSEFFQANQLQLGQELEIISGGKIRAIMVAGAGMNPEFTYPLRDPGVFIPDPERYGIAFLPLEDMENIFPEYRGKINSVVFTLEPGTEFIRVKDKLELELEKFGVKSIYPREDQVSHFILTERLTQIGRFSNIVPFLFLMISGIILYIMLKRIVEQQRGQIGLLMAFGYTRREIILHFLSYALIVGTIGGIAGGLLGMYLANPLTRFQLGLFNLPPVYTGFSLNYLLLAILLSLLVFLFSGYQGCKLALQLKPAEALRPPAPPTTKKSLPEKINLYWEMLTVQGKMATRNLFRHRSRSAFLFLGIMLSYAVIALTWNLSSLMDRLLLYHHEEIEINDAKITIAQPAPRHYLQGELEQIPGIDWVDPLGEVPATLSRGWLEEEVIILGVPREARLYNLLDEEGKRVPPSPKGLILSQRLAEKLSLFPGDTLKMESPFFRKTDHKEEIRVIDVIPQYLGMNAYMEISGLEEMLGQEPFATSLLLELNNAHNNEEIMHRLRDNYWESEMVTGIDGKEELVRRSKEIMEVLGNVFYVFSFIGFTMGFSIIYSSSFIILSERRQELSVMKILGMTSREVFSVITFEQWFISFFAMLAGIPLAQLMLRSLSQTLSTDLFTLPHEMETPSLLVALLATAFFIGLAQGFALKRVEKLDLTETVKTLE